MIHLFVSLAFFAARTTVAFPLPQNKAAFDKIAFDRVDEDTVLFSVPDGDTPPKPLKTGLFDLSYLGVLHPSEGGAPYFLFSGKPCQNCLDDRAIYAVRPIGGKPTAFVYPGKILDPRSRATLLDSRGFFGKCLPNRGDSLIFFQKERIDRRRSLQSSVYIAEAGKDFFDENLIERRLPNIKTTLQRVKLKLCKEIEGRNRLMLNKPLDLHPHSDTNNDDDDDDNNNDSDKDTSPPAKTSP